MNYKLGQLLKVTEHKEDYVIMHFIKDCSYKTTKEKVIYVLYLENITEDEIRKRYKCLYKNEFIIVEEEYHKIKKL